MKIYTISPCLLEKVIASDVDALRLLLKFFTDSDIGLALDNKNRAINYYTELIKKSKSQILLEWLNLLTNCHKFTVIDLSDSFKKDDLFLEICSKTFGLKKMILVGSKQNFSQFQAVSDQAILYNGVNIYLLDTSDALSLFERQPGIHIDNVSNSNISESGTIINK